MENISRDTFNALKHYVGVRLQQGVPIVDADWNEAFDIRKFELQAFLKWFMGDGIPQGTDGFRIMPIARSEQPEIDPLTTFEIGQGICLVDGWDVVNDNAFSYQGQPLFGNNSLAAQWNVPPLLPLSSLGNDEETRVDLVYLDVWERIVGENDPFDTEFDPSIVNETIGIETCVRQKREWVVRVEEGLDEDVVSNIGSWSSPKLRGHAYYPLALLGRNWFGINIEDEDEKRTQIVTVLRDLRRIVSRFSGSAEHITLKENKVGIGTRDPLDALQVNGGIAKLALGSATGAVMNYGTSYLGFNAARTRVEGNVGKSWILHSDTVNNGGAVVFGNIFGDLSFATIPSTQEDENQEIADEDLYGSTRLKIDREGRVGIGTNAPGAKLDVNGAIHARGPSCLLYHRTNESGIPNNDGFRLRYNPNFFGTDLDALVIEKTDCNQDDPDGGIVFVNTGKDGDEQLALSVRGNGRVGVGEKEPRERLQIGHNSSGAAVFHDGDNKALAWNAYWHDGWKYMIDGFASKIYVDNENRRLSLRTAMGRHGTPIRWSEGLTIDKEGNVGIGTASPNVKLEIDGNVQLTESLKFADNEQEFPKFTRARFAADDAETTLKLDMGFETSGVNTPTPERPSFEFAVGHKNVIQGHGERFDRSLSVSHDGQVRRVTVGTPHSQSVLNVHGSIYQRNVELYADYVFEPEYQLESIEEHAEFMWGKKRLKSMPILNADEEGYQTVEIGAFQRGTLEELEKAHIYIEQLYKRVTYLEQKVASLSDA